MLEKIALLMKDNYVTFPKALLTNYRSLNLNEKETLLLIYLINEKNLAFNPQKISEDLKISFEEVLEIISNLTSKDLVEIKMIKENNIHREYLSLDKLFKKLAFSIIDDNKSEDKKSDIYGIFEREFGRTLSPNETLIIGQMLEENSEELLTCALNEAVYNDVRTLRYIDHILAAWRQKGIKNKTDVENNKKEFKKGKKEVKKLFDYDYLNEDE